MLDCQRHLFSLPQSVRYLNCAYMSPLLKSVEEAGIKGVQQKRLPYQITGKDFFEVPRQTRQLFSMLINAPSPDSITLLPSVSYGMAIVNKNLDAKKGQNIVTVGSEFPSNVYAWKSKEKQGVEIRFVQPPETTDNAFIPDFDGEREYQSARGARWNEEILSAIDDNTVLVVLCPLHWADGTLFDLKIIGDAARSVGAMLVIDGTQAIGAMPFDVQIIRPDALIAGSYKSMMGAYSIGCAYWGERFTDGEPLEETWMERKGSEDFRNLVHYQKDYTPGMNRFTMGEQSNFALVPMLRAAITQLLEWQPERVTEYCANLIAPLISFCKESDYWIEESHWRAQHLFGIRIPAHLSFEKLQQELSARNVFVSLRGDSIRVSPNVYNTQEDIFMLIDALTASL